MTSPNRTAQLKPGARATYVFAEAGENPAELLASVGLATKRSRPVIVACGGADDLVGPHLILAERITRSVVGPVARQAGAAVVDGGTASGVMSLMGAERATAGLSVLLGVAPAGRVRWPGEDDPDRVELECNHSHFVLHDSATWGAETELLIGLAAELGGGAPVVMVLAGGGAVARGEVRAAVARRWPLYVIAGTGGLADDIVDCRRARRHRSGDDELRDLVAAAELHVVSDSDSRELVQHLNWDLQDEQTLKDAWVMCAGYDALAIRLRRNYERLETAIVCLGVVATLIALLQKTLGGAVLHWMAVPAAMLVSALIALISRRAIGRRWVLIRGAAETIKSEIYRYRTRTGLYAASLDEPHSTRQRRLAARLSAIDADLMRSDASCGALAPYAGPLPPVIATRSPDDDGLSELDADRYLAFRLADQMSYYHGKTQQLDRRRLQLQVITVAVGAAGAVLAAAGLVIWIALTTAISSAALAFLTAMRVDGAIIAYNQSAARLVALQREFREARRAGDLRPAFDALVTAAEGVLVTETAGWVEQMSTAIREHVEHADVSEPHATSAASGPSVADGDPSTPDIGPSRPGIEPHGPARPEQWR